MTTLVLGQWETWTAYLGKNYENALVLMLLTLLGPHKNILNLPTCKIVPYIQTFEGFQLFMCVSWWTVNKVLVHENIHGLNRGVAAGCSSIWVSKSQLVANMGHKPLWYLYPLCLLTSWIVLICIIRVCYPPCTHLLVMTRCKSYTVSLLWPFI